MPNKDLNTETRAASAVNVELTMLYWNIGKLLGAQVSEGERVAYGQQVMKGLLQ